MKKIFFTKGTAFERNRQTNTKKDLLELNVQDQCENCGFTGCDDCFIVMKDLATDNKFVFAVLNGELVITTYANYLVYKESGDTADLSATVVGTQS